MNKCWYVIPARGGSVGVVRKNVKLLGGMPLIAHTLDKLLKLDSRSQIIIITDDDEIVAIANYYKVNVIIEPKTTGLATLDEVIYKSLGKIYALNAKEEDYLLTIQATCPFITIETIKKAREVLATTSYQSVLSAVEENHLTWRYENNIYIPNYERRMNRQQLPPIYKETGAIIGSTLGLIEKYKTRINNPVNLIVLDDQESLDIDDHADMAIAHYYHNRLKIILRCDATSKLGMGHVYRMLAVAQELSHHDITIVLNQRKSLGVKFFKEKAFNIKYTHNNAPSNLIISHKSPDIYSLLKHAEFTVGVFSTTIYEAIYFGSRIILVDMPGVSYMQHLIGKDKALLTRTPEEFVKNFKKSKCISSNEYYSNSLSKYP